MSICGNAKDSHMNNSCDHWLWKDNKKYPENVGGALASLSVIVFWEKRNVETR